VIRAVKLSLKFATAKKRRAIAAVLDRYRSSTNKYIEEIWDRGGSLDKETAEYVSCGRLSFRQRSHALQQSLSIISATVSSAKEQGSQPSRPHFHGAMILSKQVAWVEPAKRSMTFDLWLKFSSLRRGRRLNIPLKATKRFRYWQSKPGAVLKTGCAIGDKGGSLYVIIWFEIPDCESKSEGRSIGVDVGINTLLMTSEGVGIGDKFKELSLRIRRCKPGSRGMRRARSTRDNYIGQCVNSLPWTELKFIGVENLKNLKKGKNKTRSKSFRKALAPWTYAYVLRRIELKAQENRVLLIPVNPAYTSQTCPSCTHRARSNRDNKRFKCTACGYEADADYVGSLNILSRAVEERTVPQKKRQQ